MLSYVTTSIGGLRERDGNDPKDAARFLDQCGSEGVRDLPGWRPVELLAALTIAAEGGKADIAKPMLGLGTGVFEIALAYRSDAFRVIYAVQLGDDIWVVHVFQKKSTQGIKTPKREVDLIRNRLKRLKEMLR